MTCYRCFLPDLAGFAGSNCTAPLLPDNRSAYLRKLSLAEEGVSGSDYSSSRWISACSNLSRSKNGQLSGEGIHYRGDGRAKAEPNRPVVARDRQTPLGMA